MRREKIAIHRIVCVHRNDKNEMMKRKRREKKTIIEMDNAGISNEQRIYDCTSMQTRRYFVISEKETAEE